MKINGKFMENFIMFKLRFKKISILDLKEGLSKKWKITLDRSILGKCYSGNVKKNVKKFGNIQASWHLR